MLPRGLRLRKGRDFQAVYRRGRSWTNRHLAIHALRHGGPERRVGFVVGKKLGGAVQRNRVRRLLREACRPLAGRLPAGIDLVIAARSAAAGAPLSELQAALQSLLERAGLLAADPAAAPAAARENDVGAAEEGKAVE